MTQIKPKKRAPFRSKDGPNEIDVHVGQRLRLRRNTLGVTQEELAEATGLTFQQIQKYEQAKNRISASRLFQFTQLLDTQVSFFFDGLEKTGKPKVQGLSESQAPFQAASDGVSNKELAEVIRTYSLISDTKMRRQFVKMMKQMSAATQNQDD